MQNSGIRRPMTHRRVMTSPTGGIGFASLFPNLGVLHLFRREMVHLCRIKPHVRYQMSRSRNQGKNKNFLISGPEYHLNETEGLTFGKNKAHHRHWRGRIPTIYAKNMRS